jgi:tRNA A37 threonylcarbamoyltransferase TsaD
MVRLLSQEHGARFDYPGKYMGDNGVMIAMTALKMHNAGIRMSAEDSATMPDQRTDDIDVKW